MTPRELREVFGDDVWKAISSFARQSHERGPRPREWLSLQIAVAYITIPLLPYHEKLSLAIRDYMELMLVNAEGRPHDRLWEFYLGSACSTRLSHLWERYSGDPITVPRGMGLSLFEETEGSCIDMAYKMIAPMTKGLDPDAPTERTIHCDPFAS